MMDKILNPIKKFFSFFKRVKKPMEDYSEALDIAKEAKKYLTFSVVMGVVLILVGSMISGVIGATTDSSTVNPLGSAVTTLSTILAVVFLILIFYFYGQRKRMSMVADRLKNLVCENCGEKLVLDENTSWEVTKTSWSEHSGKNSASAVLYVKFLVTCRCPSCGEEKSFSVELSPGKIYASSAGSHSNIISNEQLITDYFNGIIHG